ncbi:hypothetical protein AYI68_g2483, partial [Smittium mucronatum]
MKYRDILIACKTIIPKLTLTSSNIPTSSSSDNTDTNSESSNSNTSPSYTNTSSSRTNPVPSDSSSTVPSVSTSTASSSTSSYPFRDKCSKDSIAYILRLVGLRNIYQLRLLENLYTRINGPGGYRPKFNLLIQRRLRIYSVYRDILIECKIITPGFSSTPSSSLSNSSSYSPTDSSGSSSYSSSSSPNTSSTETSPGPSDSITSP